MSCEGAGAQALFGVGRGALIQRSCGLSPAVCDDGMPLAAEERPLERWAAGLGPLLARPLFADSMLLAQATGG